MADMPHNMLIRRCAIRRWQNNQKRKHRDRNKVNESTSVPAGIDLKPTQDAKEQTHEELDVQNSRRITRETVRGQRHIPLSPADRYALFHHRSWPTTDPADEYVGVRFKQAMHTALLALHELDTIYRHPYLYEFIFYVTLDCKTHLTLLSLINDSIPHSAFPPTGPISILEIEAGSGMIGRQLRKQFRGAVDRMEVTGIDTSVCACAVVKRNQWIEPGRSRIYNDCFVLDVTDTTSAIVKGFRANPFHLVIISRALGPGPHDVSLDVFDTAIECLCVGSHIIVMIEERNMSSEQLFGNQACLAIPWERFVNKLERASMGRGSAVGDDEWHGLRVVVQKKYMHRMSVNGVKIWYTAVIFEKLSQKYASSPLGSRIGTY